MHFGVKIDQGVRVMSGGWGGGWEMRSLELQPKCGRG